MICQVCKKEVNIEDIDEFSPKDVKDGLNIPSTEQEEFHIWRERPNNAAQLNTFIHYKKLGDSSE